MRSAQMGSIPRDGPCGTSRRPHSRTPIRRALGRFPCGPSIRRSVRHQLSSLPPPIDLNNVVVYERAGQVRSEHTAAPMMQLLSDVDHDTPQPECPVRRDHNRVRRSSRALVATTMVLIDISTAPTVESSTIPHATGTPAASGPPTLLAMRWRTRADQPCAAIIDGRTAGLESRRQHINGLRL